MERNRTIKTVLTTALAVLLLVGLGMASTARSQDYFAKFHEVHAHRFMSAPQREADHWYVYYSVCNQSTKVSGFHWKLAGFGVGAPLELQLNLCAFKRASGPSLSVSAAQAHRLLDEQDSEVEFQGGPQRVYVRTWVPCTETPIVGNRCGSGILDKFGRYLSQLNFFVSADGKNVSMETIHVEFRRNHPDENTAMLRVYGTRGVEHFAVVFPETSLQVAELASLFKDRERLSFATFGAFSTGLQLTPSMLAQGIGAKSPVLSLRPNPDRKAVDEHLVMHSLRKIGDIALIGLAIQGKSVVARNDVTIPR
jgi:hypothetical protein